MLVSGIKKKKICIQVYVINNKHTCYIIPCIKRL